MAKKKKTNSIDLNSFYKDFWKQKTKSKSNDIVSPTNFFKNWTHAPLFPKQMIPVDKTFTNDYKSLSTNINELVIGFGKRCLDGSTKLKDEETNREYTIKELSEKKKAISIKSVKVIGSNQKGWPKGRVVTQKTGVPFYKGKSKIYRVKTESGKEILVGGHHRFLSKSGWKEIKDLKVKEEIMVSKAPNESLSKEQEKQRKNKISKKMKMLTWDKITEIEYVGENDIYDLEVPETNTYIAQGFVSHNSGKDFLISNLLTYILYFLLKQSDPAEFLGLKSGEPIDIVNVSFDEPQAKTVFFKRLKNRIKGCINPETKRNFFEEQGMDLNRDIQKNSIIFPKNITAYSLNSVKFKAEGKNVVFAIFDEIAQFRFDKADAIRRHIKTTAKATCPKFFKLFYISFLTNGNDYMANLLEKAEKGEMPKTFYMRESTWNVRSQRGCPKELKPYIVHRSTYQDEFDEDQENSTLMFECKVPKTRKSSFIKRPEKILQSVGYILDQNGEKIFREDPRIENEKIIVYDDELKDLEFESWFRPFYTWEIWQLERQYDIQPSEELENQIIKLKERQQTAEYYTHIDLSRGVVDSAGIGLGHRYYIMDRIKIYIDLILAIRARKEQEIDMSKILDFILLRLHKGKKSLGGLGFNIQKITSDGWNSSLFLNLCERENMEAELISLERTTAPYNTFKDFIYKQGINYYPYPPLLRETEELIITDNGKIQHPRSSRRRMKEEGLSKGSKDCSDCCSGLSYSMTQDSEEGDMAWTSDHEQEE